MDYQNITHWNLYCNIICLLFFLGGRSWKPLKRVYDGVKFSWALQIVVPFASPDLMGMSTKFLITYGFGFDFMILEISASSTSQEEILFRFLTNLVHHLTLFEESPILKYVYTVCWMTHLFPWLGLAKNKNLFKAIAEIGNVAPAIGLVAVVSTGEWSHDLSQASRSILLMMVVFRGIYINAFFHVFSGHMIMSPTQEERIKECGRKLTIVVSCAAVLLIYSQPSTSVHVLAAHSTASLQLPNFSSRTMV